jgi:hypothetical protein
VKPAEAVRLIAMLGAYYSREIGTDTAGLWAKSLVAFEVQDGMEAVHLLGSSGRFLPSLADLTDTIRECRNDRLKQEREQRPLTAGTDTISFERWFATMATDQEKVAMRHSLPSLAAKYDITASSWDGGDC